MKYILAVKNGNTVLRKQEFSTDRIPVKGEKLVVATNWDPETFIVKDVYNLVYEDGTSTVVVEVEKEEAPQTPGILEYYRRLAGK